MDFRVARRKENRMPRSPCDERCSKAAGSASIMWRALCAFTFRCESVAFQQAARFVSAGHAREVCPRFAFVCRLRQMTIARHGSNGSLCFARNQMHPWRLELEGSTFLDG